MRKDNTAFRERFQAWKEGKKPYQDGLPAYRGGKEVTFSDDEALEYIMALENPGKVGWDSKSKVWRTPKQKGYDKNQIAYGLDIREEHNPAVYNFLKSKGRLNDPWLTDAEARNLMLLSYSTKGSSVEKAIEKAGGKISQRGYNVLRGMAWHGHPIKQLLNPDSVTGKAFLRAIANGDQDLNSVFDTYYGYGSNATQFADRIKADAKYRGSIVMETLGDGNKRMTFKPVPQWLPKPLPKPIPETQYPLSGSQAPESLSSWNAALSPSTTPTIPSIQKLNNERNAAVQGAFLLPEVTVLGNKRTSLLPKLPSLGDLLAINSPQQLMNRALSESLGLADLQEDDDMFGELFRFKNGKLPRFEDGLFQITPRLKQQSPDWLKKFKYVGSPRKYTTLGIEDVNNMPGQFMTLPREKWNPYGYGKQYTIGIDPRDVDQRSDTTRLGVHEGEIPYGASEWAGQGPMSILETPIPGTGGIALGDLPIGGGKKPRRWRSHSSSNGFVFDKPGLLPKQTGKGVGYGDDVHIIQGTGKGDRVIDTPEYSPYGGGFGGPIGEHHIITGRGGGTNVPNISSGGKKYKNGKLPKFEDGTESTDPVFKENGNPDGAWQEQWLNGRLLLLQENYSIDPKKFDKYGTATAEQQLNNLKSSKEYRGVRGVNNEYGYDFLLGDLGNNMGQYVGGMTIIGEGNPNNIIMYPSLTLPPDTNPNYIDPSTRMMNGVLISPNMTDEEIAKWNSHLKSDPLDVRNLNMIHERTHALSSPLKNKDKIGSLPQDYKIDQINKKHGLKSTKSNSTHAMSEEEYHMVPNEIYAGLMLQRYALGLTPDHVVTKEEIRLWKNEGKLNQFLKDKPDDVLLEYFNEVASNPNPLFDPTNVIQAFGPAEGRMLHAKNGKSPIYIKPANRGKLTRLKLRTGKSESELYNDGNPAHKKMVVFARNARKWKH